MATYPAGMVQTLFQFGLYDDNGDVELAEFGLWAQVQPGDTPTDWDAALIGLAEEAYASWVDNWTAGWFSAFVKLDAVKCVQYGTDAKTEHEQIYVPTTKWAGTASGSSLPWQISLCIGIYSYTPGTFIPHNRRRRGRIYLPPMATALISNNANAELDSSHVTQALQSTNDMLLQCIAYELPSSPGPSGMVWGVFSREAQFLYTCTDLAADNKWDTQRRRVRQLDAIRQSKQLEA